MTVKGITKPLSVSKNCRKKLGNKTGTQDERWIIRYNEVMEFISTNHRNPSKYNLEERNMYTFIKHTRKQMNQGLLKAERIPMFEKLLQLMEQYKRKNQWV